METSIEITVDFLGVKIKGKFVREKNEKDYWCRISPEISKKCLKAALKIIADDLVPINTEIQIWKYRRDYCAMFRSSATHTIETPDGQKEIELTIDHTEDKLTINHESLDWMVAEATMLANDRRRIGRQNPAIPAPQRRLIGCE